MGSEDEHEEILDGETAAATATERVKRTPKTTRSKAAFKATRERVGMTQQDVADALGVRVRSVKRWEHESMPSYHAPAKAYELLESALEGQRKTVSQYVSAVNEQTRGLRAEADPVPITYYRDQAMYDLLGHDEGCYGMANADARATAQELERMGYTVEFHYPTEDAAATPEGAR